jgi:tetratricopeptide (TPR) repeat protein
MSALSSPSPADVLLSEARGCAARGAWTEVAQLFAGRGDQGLIATQPELAVLQGEAALRLGKPQESLSCLSLGVQVLERRGDRATLRRAVNLVGAAYFEVGDLGDAKAAFERALELANADGDDLLVARATNNLASIANVQGQHEASLSLYQLAVASYQRIGSAAGLAGTFHNMAIIYRDARRLDQADEYERRAIEFARQAQDPRLPAAARAARAELSLLRGEARVAEAGARIAAREYAAIPDPAGEADALRLMGAARAALGSVDGALEALNRAVALAQEHGSALVEAESRRARAELFATQDLLEEARNDAVAAIVIYQRLGASAECGILQKWLADLPTG